MSSSSKEGITIIRKQRESNNKRSGSLSLFWHLPSHFPNRNCKLELETQEERARRARRGGGGASVSTLRREKKRFSFRAVTHHEWEDEAFAESFVYNRPSLAAGEQNGYYIFRLGWWQLTIFTLHGTTGEDKLKGEGKKKGIFIKLTGRGERVAPE